MKKIELTQGKFALVDDDAFPLVARFNWHAIKGGGLWYAVRGVNVGGKIHRIFMHRYLMLAVAGQSIDHVNGDGLDNRLENLRVCSHQQNHFNRKPNANSISGFKGVSFCRKEKNPWLARIMRDGKMRRLGAFSTPEEAARAYDKAALELFGEFARLNFPEKRGA